MKRKMILAIVFSFCLCFMSHTALAVNDWIMETDNHDATLTGTWSTSTARILYYGDDYRATPCSGNAGTVTATATFVARTSLDVTGRYSVYARWTIDPNRSTAAPYQIFKDDGDAAPMATVTVNQEGHGGEWRYLGYWNFTTGDVPKVVLRNNCAAEADGAYVIADAVRWVKENIDAGDTVDEPGIEWAWSSSHAIDTLTVNCAALNNLTSITVTAPASGYVHVQASGIAKLTTNSAWVRVGIDTLSGGATFDSLAPYLEVTSQAGDYANEKVFSLNKVYSVAAGATTWYLKACREAGATGSLMWDEFTAVYYATTY